MADPKERLGDRDLDADRQVTEEVGGEGGSPGDVEVERKQTPGKGSETGTTWSPTGPKGEEIARDKQGRRNP